MVGNTKTWVSIGETMQEIATKGDLSTMGGAKLVYAGLVDVTAKWSLYIYDSLQSKEAFTTSKSIFSMESTDQADIFNKIRYKLNKGTVLATVPNCDFITVRLPVGTYMTNDRMRMYVTGTNSNFNTKYNSSQGEYEISGTDLLNVTITNGASAVVAMSLLTYVYLDNNLDSLYNPNRCKVRYEGTQLILDTDISVCHFKWIRDLYSSSGDYLGCEYGPQSINPYYILGYKYQ